MLAARGTGSLLSTEGMGGLGWDKSTEEGGIIPGMREGGREEPGIDPGGSIMDMGGCWG
jgi:hypothetical protein